MTDATPLEELTIEEGKLQTEFEAAQKLFFAAKEDMELKSERLVRFRNKFGRVLQLFREE